MPYVVADRVKETTTTSGTGTITLAGAADGFQSFATIGDGNTTYYAIVDGVNWEVGIGTYTATGTTLSRDTILASSNSDAAITLSGSAADVFCTSPASNAAKTDNNDNTYLGIDALNALTTGADNTAIGYTALNTETSGTKNCCVGNYAGYTQNGKTQVTCVGYEAGYLANNNYQTNIGVRAGYRADSTYQTNVGAAAGYNLKGGNNTVVGALAGYGNSSYTSVLYNTFVGYECGYTIYGGDYNTAVGYLAGRQLVNGVYNSFLGLYAGYGNSSSYSTCVGGNAGRESDGGSNTAIGYRAGYYLDGSYNIAIGRNALDENSVTGSYNIGIGYNTSLSSNSTSNECQIGAPNAATGQITRLDVGGCDFTMNTTALYYGYEIRAGGDVVAYYSSDATLKENVQNIPDALSKVNAIRGVTYDWKDDYLATKGKVDDYFNRKHDVGVIAQEVEAVLPEVVAERKDGTKAVRYEKLTALLIEAVNDLTNEVQTLKAELKELKDGVS